MKINTKAQPKKIHISGQAHVWQHQTLTQFSVVELLIWKFLHPTHVQLNDNATCTCEEQKCM
jgi:hypothetical protein